MKEIPLSGPKGEGKFALVDDEDFAELSQYTWRLSPSGYAITDIFERNSQKQLFLHRVILNPPANREIDHIDGNRLNDQRANLRCVTHAQNSYNMTPQSNGTSIFKGVSWDNRLELWVAYISPGKIHVYLGSFVSELDAARAYNAAAIEHFGEYARLNVIPDDPVKPVRYRQAVPYTTNNRTSKYLGVSHLPSNRRWRATIRIARKKIHLGCFDTAEEAARAYDAAAKFHHGDRAFLNFPD